MTQREAMRRYNLTIRAIIDGNRVLCECDEDERNARYPAYLALFKRLPDYVKDAGWMPSEPWEGYDDADYAQAAS